jgi:hypothetical protein
MPEEIQENPIGYVLNPFTGRYIKEGGSSHKKMLKRMRNEKR